MADGSIRIETKLDNSALKQQIKELERELKNIQKEQAKTDAQVSQTRAKYDAEREFDSQFPEEFSQRQDIDQRAAKELDPIIAKQEELNQKEQEYLQKLDAAKAKLAEQAQIASASKQVDDAVKADSTLGKVQSQAEYNSLLEATRAKMAAIEDAAAEVAEKNGLIKEEILAVNREYQKLLAILGMLEARADDFGDAGQGAGRGTGSAMGVAAANTKKVGDETRRGIAIFGKAQLAMMGIMFAMRAVSAATQEYMAVNSELEGQMNTLKALWGQVLGPVIEWVINLLIQAISAVNAFVYALSGINLVAKANAAALKKQEQAGSGGGNQTAGFDEQTKLSGGSGGSGNAVATLPDGTSMDLSFLDPLMEALKKFKEDITPLLNTIGNLFKWIWEEVLVPFGDWALNSMLPAFLNILGGAFLVLNDALEVVLPVLKWLWDNILAPIAKWTGGVIVDVLNAIGDWIHEHHETLGKLAGTIAIIVGVVLLLTNAGAILATVLSGVGTVLAFLGSVIASPITWITALIALFVTCYDECEGFRQGLQQVADGFVTIWEGLCTFVGAFLALFRQDWDEADRLLGEAEEKFIEGGKAILEGLLNGLKAGWEWIKEKVTEIWNKIITKFKEIFGIHSPSTVFEGFGVNMIAGLVSGISGSISRVVQACRSIWIAIKGVFSPVATWFKDTFSNAWQNVKDIFSSGGKIFDGIKDGIASVFKTIVNGLISGINRVIAIPFNKINNTLNAIRGISILGVEPFKNLWGYNPLSVPQIPKLALGGIVNRPGRGVPAIIGEAGAEAVLPLENNTEWMDILADKIGGGTITIPITLDGKRIATYIVDIQKKKAFAMNGA